MSELEQLRKEVNELRERIARLESRTGQPLTHTGLRDWNPLIQPQRIPQEPCSPPPGWDRITC